MKMEASVAEEQRFHALNLGLHATPAHWWETHKNNMCTGMNASE